MNSSKQSTLTAAAAELDLKFIQTRLLICSLSVDKESNANIASALGLLKINGNNLRSFLNYFFNFLRLLDFFFIVS